MFLNKSIHTEVVDYPYSEADFDFGEDVEALLLFSAHIGPNLASLIKYNRSVRGTPGIIWQRSNRQ